MSVTQENWDFTVQGGGNSARNVIGQSNIYHSIAFYGFVSLVQPV